MAYFPTSPTNGQTVTVNGILYTYNTTKGAWKRATSTFGNLDVSGNITAANITISSNAAANKFYVTDGIYWAGNGTAFASTTYSNANVTSHLLQGANIGSGSTTGNLVAAATTPSTNTTTGALVVRGGAGVAGALFITNTGDVSANIGSLLTNAATQQTQINSIVTNANANVAAYLPTYTGNIGAGNIITTGTSGNITGVSFISASNYVYPNGVSILTGIGGTYSNTNVEAYFGANIGSLLVNAASQATSINTINANLGAYQIYANANIGSLLVNAASQATSINTINANLGAYQIYANANIGSLLVNAATQQTQITNIVTNANTNTAAYLTLGANIGSGSTTGNLVANATTTSTSTTTGALVVRGGAGVVGNVTADKFYTVNGIYWSSNGAAYGAAFTASSAAPSSPSVGSFWYKTTTDVLYEYINDGTTNYWIDIQSPSVAANVVTSTYVGDVYGGNISFTGAITGSVGYLLERANVVAGAPPAVTNLDLITAPIMYFTSNSTQNITANIRGNSTVTLNSMLAVGQSSTFVIFVPNATGYYVSTVKVDNTTVSPFWQGGSTVVGGNANSIDIYTFAVLKTANATFKVFASQVRYQNLGP